MSLLKKIGFTTGIVSSLLTSGCNHTGLGLGQYNPHNDPNPDSPFVQGTPLDAAFSILAGRRQQTIIYNGAPQQPINKGGLLENIILGLPDNCIFTAGYFNDDNGNGVTDLGELREPHKSRIKMNEKIFVVYHKKGNTSYIPIKVELVNLESGEKGEAVYQTLGPGRFEGCQFLGFTEPGIYKCIVTQYETIPFGEVLFEVIK